VVWRGLTTALVLVSDKLFRRNIQTTKHEGSQPLNHRSNGKSTIWDATQIVTDLTIQSQVAIVKADKHLCAKQSSRKPAAARIIPKYEGNKANKVVLRGKLLVQDQLVKPNEGQGVRGLEEEGWLNYNSDVQRECMDNRPFQSDELTELSQAYNAIASVLATEIMAVTALTSDYYDELDHLQRDARDADVQLVVITPSTQCPHAHHIHLTPPTADPRYADTGRWLFALAEADITVVTVPGYCSRAKFMDAMACCRRGVRGMYSNYNSILDTIITIYSNESKAFKYQFANAHIRHGDKWGAAECMMAGALPRTWTNSFGNPWVDIEDNCLTYKNLNIPARQNLIVYSTAGVHKSRVPLNNDGLERLVNGQIEWVNVPEEIIVIDTAMRPTRDHGKQWHARSQNKDKHLTLNNARTEGMPQFQNGNKGHVLLPLSGPIDHTKMKQLTAMCKEFIAKDTTQGQTVFLTAHAEAASNHTIRTMNITNTDLKHAIKIRGTTSGQPRAYGNYRVLIALCRVGVSVICNGNENHHLRLGKAAAECCLQVAQEKPNAFVWGSWNWNLNAPAAGVTVALNPFINWRTIEYACQILSSMEECYGVDEYLLMVLGYGKVVAGENSLDYLNAWLEQPVLGIMDRHERWQTTLNKETAATFGTADGQPIDSGSLAIYATLNGFTRFQRATV
jgi:hypothetical protein